jgi:hypothetical protein
MFVCIIILNVVLTIQCNVAGIIVIISLLKYFCFCVKVGSKYAVHKQPTVTADVYLLQGASFVLLLSTVINFTRIAEAHEIPFL